MNGLLLGALLAARALAAAPLSTDDRRRALLLTDLLIEGSRLEEADAVVGERLDAEPAGYDWLLRRARIRTAQGRAAEAQAYYKKLLADKPDDPGVLVAYADQAYAGGDPAEARRAYERAARLSRDPRAPYMLAELAFADGDSRRGERWAREALSRLKSPKDAGEKRMSLRLRARLSWSDALEDEYAKLFAEAPGEPETLAQWAESLLREGLADAAREPIELLRERFPEPQDRWRLLEARRLALAGDADAQLAFLRESARLLPREPSLAVALSAAEARRRDWPASERAAVGVTTRPYSAEAAPLLVEAIRAGHTFAGPYSVWRRSTGTRAVQFGVAGRGYAAKRVLWTAEASRDAYTRRSTGRGADVTGGAASAAYEAPRWTLGADLDARGGEGGSFVSPGVFGSARPLDGVSVSARAYAGRFWRDATEGAVLGASARSGQLSVQARVLRRLVLGGYAAVYGLRLPGGETAAQSQLSPEAWVVLLDSPFYAALGYRVLAADATGEDAFFARLPLVRRTRAQYMTLSLGREWFDGRLRADGFVFNGHEPEHGRKFGNGANVGFGAHVEWLAGRFRFEAAYDHTKEDDLGVGGRSETARLSAQWRWAPPARVTAP